MPYYCIDTLCFFWLPSVVLYVYLIKKISGLKLKAFHLNLLMWCVITFIFEYVCLSLDIWNFTENYSPLVGINIIGVPIEEFLFWFGAAVFFPLLYLFLTELDTIVFPRVRKRRRSACSPAPAPEVR